PAHELVGGQVEGHQIVADVHVLVRVDPLRANDFVVCVERRGDVHAAGQRTTRDQATGARRDRASGALRRSGVTRWRRTSVAFTNEASERSVSARPDRAASWSTRSPPAGGATPSRNQGSK